MKNVKCEMWKVCICQSTLDFAHGNYLEINEFYIPKYKISFNIVNDRLNVLRTGDRYTSKDHVRPPKKIGDGKLPADLAMGLKEYVDLREMLSDGVVKMFAEWGKK